MLLFLTLVSFSVTKLPFLLLLLSIGKTGKLNMKKKHICRLQLDVFSTTKLIEADFQNCSSNSLNAFQGCLDKEQSHQDVNTFMILLFLFSLYFWTNALFHIASTFDPLGSFSRIVKFTRLCHAFAPRPRYQAPPGNQINISPTKVRVANPWRLSGRVSETQSIRLPSLHMQFIEPGHRKLGI